MELQTLLLLGAGAIVAGVSLAAMCRVFALRIGAVCQPQRDRWSATPVPLFGGPAIVATTALGMALVPGGLPPTLWVLLAGAVTLSIVGLVDDLRPIAPYTKLTAQLATAGIVTAFGLRFPLTGVPVIDVLVTVAWIVALSNAFNLLDNMDGLSAGIATITGVVKLVLFVMEGQWPAAWACAVFVGACLGFLVLNFNPARIFMGDAGSMFLGFFVAGLSTVGVTPDSRVTVSVLVAPVAVMLVPIFDTVFVTILRIRAGRPISQGGRDHTSHRLVTAGLSERRAVLTLYGLAAASGVIAIVTRGAGLGVGLALFAGLALGTLLLGVTLARITIHQTDRAVPASHLRLQRAPGLSYVRQVATACIDGLLVLLSLYAAWAFSRGAAGTWTSGPFVQVLPLVFSAKMIALAVFRSTSRVWRYTNSHDLMALAASSALGSTLAMAAVWLVYGFHAMSPAIIVLDAMLLTGLLSTSRLLLRGLSELLRPAPREAARVLIYGAGDGGVTLLQELRNNSALGRVVVGFLDDDASKTRTRIQGLPVFGGAGTLRDVLRRRVVNEVIVATGKVPVGRMDEIAEICGAAGVMVSRFRVAIQNIPSKAHLRRTGSVESARLA
jgi:UDP-GlcNAc:undecaprenyl-phosphate GlcNAc-1-phosphate transferase